MEPETNFFLLASKELNKRFNDNGDSNSFSNFDLDINSFGTDSKSNNSDEINKKRKNEQSNFLKKDFEKRFKDFDKRLEHISKLEKDLEVKTNENQQLESFLVSKISKLETKIEKLERISNYKKIVSENKTFKHKDIYSKDASDFDNLVKKLKKIKEDFNPENPKKTLSESKLRSNINEDFINEIGSFKLKTDDKHVEKVFELKNKLKLLIEEYDDLKDDFPKKTLSNLENKILKVESMLYKTMDKL